MENVASDKPVTLFCEVLLPVPVPKFFTYRIPQTLNNQVQTGQRAIVQFGDRKILTGLIITVHSKPPAGYEAKYILELLDDLPVVSELQMRLFFWMADYYLCTNGEVMNAALPSGLKLSSESMVQLHPSFDLDTSDQAFSEKELVLLKYLEHESLSYTSISNLLGVKHLYSILKSLVGKEAIILFEEVKEKFRPKTMRKVRLCDAFTSSEVIEDLFQTLSTRPKQEAVLLKYLQSVPVLQNPGSNQEGLSRKQLMDEDISESSLNTLIKNNILEEFTVSVSRFEPDEHIQTPYIQLSEEQKQAHNEVLNAFGDNSVALLHGITGSGKTEIYINLIKQALEGGSQVLYLLPEIALTTQIVNRLKKIFGGTMGVYHSRFSDNERVEVWRGIITGRFRFVVGVRSSVFLPFDNLGLVIIDEEHDPSYKQQDPAPRYHARDVGIMLGQIHHAKVLLGSATPSVETYFNAQHGKYALINLHKRFGDAQLPIVELANMAVERKQKTAKGDLSGLLLKKIEVALTNKEQVIIFQNRRGYAPMVSCLDCGWVPKCVNCAVSLTYHQFRHALICHYCGYKELPPARCPTCSSARLKNIGYGTEKLEEELTLQFPEASVQRMDLDTTRTKTSYETIIDRFEKGETNVLVGTQMVTKGLDFDRVSLVGIFSADKMMHFPDFRSYERAFQLITQVSGRAGRRDKPGTVVIQTSNPEHPLLQMILLHDVDAFYRSEEADRQRNHYPPFTRLIEITVKNSDKKGSRATAVRLSEYLRAVLPGVRVLGPGEPVVSKIRNLYLMNILIKIPRGSGDLGGLKQKIKEQVALITKEKDHKNSKILIDVDPV